MSFPSTPPPVPGIVHTDVRVDRTRWHVATAGDGPPVLLLHGWPQNWWMWRRVMADLARTHRVYAPDLRGFGWSDAPEGRYSKMGLACDVERLIDELGLDECTLVGHDWGGFVSLLTAIRAPERIRRVVAFSIIHPWTTLRSPDPVTALLTAAYQGPMSMPVLGPALQMHAPALLRQVLRLGVAPGFTWSEEDVRLYLEGFRRRAHARAASALYRTFVTNELPAMLRGRYANRRLEMPVLLATGEHDRVVTPERVSGYERYAPQMRTQVLDGVGHFVVDERPSLVIELIRGELDADA